MRLALIFSILACSSVRVWAGSAVLRGRSPSEAATTGSTEDLPIHSAADRELEAESAIPSYEQILNIFNRAGGGGGGGGRNNNKRNKRRKNRRRKNKNNNNKSSSSSDDDDNKSVHDDSSDIPKNKDLGFLWKLWYTKGIKYEQRGTDFCVMCKGKSGCEKGDEVVTSHCNPNDPDMRWEYIKVKNGVGLIKTRHHNLCLEMNDMKFYKLQKCDENEERQMFQGLSYKGKFKLHPYKRRFAEQKQCISMLHHPLAKDEHDGEEIIDQPCHKPERTQTVYWVTDWRDEVQETIGSKDHDCSEKNPCKECEGDCSNDDDCKGSLKCFQRNGDGWRVGVEKGWHPNAWAEIPGCQGMGKYGRDYCFDPRKA